MGAHRSSPLCGSWSSGQKPGRPPFGTWPHAPSRRAVSPPRGFPATPAAGLPAGVGKGQPRSERVRCHLVATPSTTHEPRGTRTLSPPDLDAEPELASGAATLWGSPGEFGGLLCLEVSGPLDGLWGSQPGAELLLPVGVAAGSGGPSGGRQQRAEAPGQAGAGGRSEYQQWRQREEAQHDKRRGAAV